MVLATYQPIDWKTCEQKGYSRLKEVLGIPQEKNIYWCFPANTPEQALINSCCTEPNQPSVLVLFNTDTYWKIDKIKWNRYVETQDESLLSEELLEVTHSEMAEYIVTDIPENYIDFPLRSELTERSEKVIDTMKFLSGNPNIFKGITTRYFLAIEMLNYSTTTEIDGDDGSATEEEKQQFSFLAVAKKACEMFLVVPVVCASLWIFKLSGQERPNSCKVPSIEEHLDLTNEYAEYCMNLPNMTDETAYEKLKDIQQKIFDLYFGHNYVKKIEGTVHPKMLCPCGSGKPYKKCCAKKNDKPDISDVMAKGID